MKKAMTGAYKGLLGAMISLAVRAMKWLITEWAMDRDYGHKKIWLFLTVGGPLV
jgi:hypothetical protein